MTSASRTTGGHWTLRSLFAATTTCGIALGLAAAAERPAADLLALAVHGFWAGVGCLLFAEKQLPPHAIENASAIFSLFGVALLLLFGGLGLVSLASLGLATVAG